jgi:hypothetical protein
MFQQGLVVLLVILIIYILYRVVPLIINKYFTPKTIPSPPIENFAKYTPAPASPEGIYPSEPLRTVSPSLRAPSPSDQIPRGNSHPRSDGIRNAAARADRNLSSGVMRYRCVDLFPDPCPAADQTKGSRGNFFPKTCSLGAPSQCSRAVA